MSTLPLDLIATYRSVRRRLGSTLALVGVLGIGTGLATAMFVIADPFITRSLPYPSPDELVVLSLRIDRQASGIGAVATQMPTVADWRARRDLFSALGPVGWSVSLQRIQANAGTLGLKSTTASSSVMAILGQPVPQCAADESGSCALVTAAAAERLALAPSLPVDFDRVGKSRLRVVQVFPAHFVFPILGVEAVLITPDAVWDDLPVQSQVMIARRQSHVSPEQIAQALNASVSGATKWSVVVESLNDRLTRDGRSAAWVALAAGVFLLLVCVSTLANLLFAEGVAREKEYATRRALGASGWDLARCAGLWIGSCAGASALAGLGFASVVVTMLKWGLPLRYSLLGTPAISARAVVCACGASVVTLLLAVLVSFFPLRGRLVNAESPGSGAQKAGRRLRYVTIAVQTALAMILCQGSLLFGRSYANLIQQQTGISGTSTFVTVSYPPSLSGQQLRDEMSNTLSRIKTIPNTTQEAAVYGGLIDSARGVGCCVMVDGRGLSIATKYVTDSFFQAIGASFVVGSNARPNDLDGVVVNQSFARFAWPGEPAVGKFIGVGGPLQPIVGVVTDMIDGALDRAPQPTVYARLKQPTPCQDCETQLTYVVATAQGAGTSSQREVLLNNAVTGPSGGLVINTSSAQDRLLRSVSVRIFATTIVGLYASAAIILCCAGLVGVVAFVIARRVRELAIRSAIGASHIDLMKTVSSEALTAAAAGVLAGALGGHLASGAARNAVYGVNAESWGYGAVAGMATMLFVGLAVGLTALRVTRIPLTLALKAE